ncbi:MAG: rRNA maturation RNase YbeY [Leadbetterella sp.]
MIYFENQHPSCKLKNKAFRKSWIKSIIYNEGFIVGNITYIFMTDDELLKINIQYLDHATYTDIITFDNSEEEKKIEGDIFISWDRIIENAATFNVNVESELSRVMAHGVLHLCGYKDKKEEEKKVMRRKEDEAIVEYEEIKKAANI